MRTFNADTDVEVGVYSTWVEILTGKERNARWKKKKLESTPKETDLIYTKKKSH